MALTNVNNFFDNLSRIEDISLFEKYCEEEKRNIEETYSVLTSKKSVYTKYRNKALIYKFEDDKNNIVRYYFKLDKVDYKILRDKYTEKVSKFLSNRKLIYSPENYINTSISLLESNKINNNIVGLAALTGRRVAEIGCSASFKYLTKNKLLFTGQLKTKTREEVKPFEIPVFHDANILIKVLNRIRYEKPQFYNNTPLFHDTCSKTISSIVKKTYVNIVEGEVTPKDLRAIYACLANFNFRPNTISPNRYIAMILGHAEIDNDTSNSYQNYYLEAE